MPETFQAASHFFDLSDFLTWKASRSLSRSLCSTVCKWTYLASLEGKVKGWSEPFFKLAGFGELSANGFEKLGNKVIRCVAFLADLNIPFSCVLL